MAEDRGGGDDCGQCQQHGTDGDQAPATEDVAGQRLATTASTTAVSISLPFR